MGGGDGGDSAVPIGPAQPPDAPGGPDRVWPHLFPPDLTWSEANLGCELRWWDGAHQAMLGEHIGLSAPSYNPAWCEGVAQTTAVPAFPEVV